MVSKTHETIRNEEHPFEFVPTKLFVPVTAKQATRNTVVVLIILACHPRLATLERLYTTATLRHDGVSFTPLSPSSARCQERIGKLGWQVVDREGDTARIDCILA